MSIINSIQKKNSWVVLCYLIFVISTFYILYRSNIILMLPDNQNLLNWDAYFFYRIVNPGYEYIPFTGTNLAFFPLFSYMWKVLNLTGIGISIFNVMLFSIGFLLIIGREKLPIVFILFLISIPSFIFFAVPYPESLFYLFGAILTYGYREDSRLFKLIGFFGISTVKAVSVILIPTIVICEILTLNAGRSRKKKVIDAVITSATSLLGLLIVASIQAYQTGKWFYFIGIQKYWGRHWIVPHFPLTTINAENILGIDAIAFIFGVLSIYLCAKWAYRFFRKNHSMKFSDVDADHPIIFSALYLAATAILDVCFTAYSNDATSIWSLNRHFLCSPFFTVLIIWLYKSYRPGKTDLLVVGALIIFGIYLTGIYAYPYMMLLYLNFFLAVGIFKFYPKFSKVVLLSVVINCAFQIIFYGDFLLKSWIG